MTANHHPNPNGEPDVTTLADPTTPTAPTAVNARAEAVFLRAETYALTARQVVHASGEESHQLLPRQLPSRIRPSRIRGLTVPSATSSFLAT